MTTYSPEYLERAFRFYAEMCAGKSPLYAALSAQVADDPRVYSLASSGQKRQPPANRLFAAVIFLDWRRSSAVRRRIRIERSRTAAGRLIEASRKE